MNGECAGQDAYRFSANTGYLWKDKPFVERILLAATHGFDAVEFHDEVQGADPGAVRDVLERTGLPVIGLNTRGGETAGCAAIPALADQAKRDIDEAMESAHRVGAGAIHVLAGRTRGKEARATYAASLRHALGSCDRIILVEPLSRVAMPGYFLDDLGLAQDLVEEIDHPRLKILFDCFHIESQHDGVEARFGEVAGMVSHVQIASVPERGEPWPSRIDYGTLLPAMRAHGYDGAFGCEYRPAGSVEAGLGWRDALRRRLSA